MSLLKTMSVPTDCTTFLLRNIEDDTIFGDSLNAQIYPLLHVKHERLKEILHKICQHVHTANKVNNFYPNLTTSGYDNNDDNLGPETNITNNCSTSR